MVTLAGCVLSQFGYMAGLDLALLQVNQGATRQSLIEQQSH
jgi:hypothetical protein